MNSFIHRKIKAFTLLELLVGMIVSGIVVAACFNAYRVVAMQFKAYKTTSAAYENFSFFESQFRADFQHAKEISGNENAIQFISREKKTDWQFREKYALRNDGNEIDTFFLPCSVSPIEQNSDSVFSLCLRAVVAQHNCEIECTKETVAADKVNAEFEKMIDDGN